MFSPPKNPEALAKNICLLLGDEALRVRLAKACNDLISRFSWERSVDLLEDFLKGVTQKAGETRERVLS